MSSSQAVTVARSAYHEAGHGVAAVVMRIDLVQVNIERTSVEARRHGFAAVTTVSCRLRDDDLADVARFVAFASAGPYAQLHLDRERGYPPPPRGYENDGQGPDDFWDAYTFSALGDGVKDLRRARPLLDYPCKVQRVVPLLVRRWWPAIDAVAAALLIRRRLDGAAVAKLVRHAGVRRIARSVPRFATTREGLAWIRRQASAGGAQ